MNLRGGRKIKVWILERYYTPEECLEAANNLEEIVEQMKTEGNVREEEIAKIEEGVKNLKDLHLNKEGKWAGFEGKSNYKTFVHVAKEAMMRNKGVEFRVVEGEIDYDSKYWTGYKAVKVNDEVMKYLKHIVND